MKAFAAVAVALLVACSDHPKDPLPQPDAGSDSGTDADSGACECTRDLVQRCFDEGIFQPPDDPDLCAFPCSGPAESLDPPFKCGTLSDGVRCCVRGHI